MNKKTVALLLALTLVFGASVGGTLAWLSDRTQEIKNTFTSSNIDITLEENAGLDASPEGGTDEVRNFAMIPGYQIAKDPVATVKAGSEDCYLFVKLVKSANYDDFLADYEMAEGWIALTDVNGVYYRVVNKPETDQAFQVLKGEGEGDFKGGCLTVKSDVTKDMMDKLTDATLPTLTITAYATQYYQTNGTEFGVQAAWEIISK